MYGATWGGFNRTTVKQECESQLLPFVFDVHSPDLKKRQTVKCLRVSDRHTDKAQRNLWLI